VRDSRYHGSFDHPVRAFLIGVTLLVLLFGGFVVGIEAGKNPIEQTGAAVRVVTTKGHVRTITDLAPVVRTVHDGHTSVVRLPGTVHRRVVAGKTVYIFRGGVIEPAPAADTSLTNSATTFFIPTTVTEPVTVTDTAPSSTVTVTVTETAPPPSSTDSSGTAQTGP
jgi:hypothetical protein